MQFQLFRLAHSCCRTRLHLSPSVGEGLLPLSSIRMAAVKEPKTASDKDKKSKKKDKKLSVSDGAVKKAQKKAAKHNELDLSLIHI